MWKRGRAPGEEEEAGTASLFLWRSRLSLRQVRPPSAAAYFFSFPDVWSSWRGKKRPEEVSERRRGKGGTHGSNRKGKTTGGGGGGSAALIRLLLDSLERFVPFPPFPWPSGRPRAKGTSAVYTDEKGDIKGRGTTALEARRKGRNEVEAAGGRISVVFLLGT